MITLFDVVAPIMILLAMQLSTMPKKAAIAICLLVSASITFADYFLGGTLAYYVFIILEFVGFIALLVSTRIIKEPRDRNYYRLMASMLLISLSITWAYLFDWIVFSSYLLLWKTAAIGHIGIMLGMSDGIRNFGRDWTAYLDRGGRNSPLH